MGHSDSNSIKKSHKEYLQYFSAADWVTQQDSTTALVIPQQTHGLTGSVLRVRIGMRLDDHQICYHTFGIYRTTIHFLPNTADIILRYPEEIGYTGEILIVSQSPQ